MIFEKACIVQKKDHARGMKILFLTAEEKPHLEASHQSCENRKEWDRTKAISLRSEGWTVPRISQA